MTVEEYRERVIEILTRSYSDDVLTMKEYEDRVDLANHAISIEELDTVVSDLPPKYRSSPAAPREPHPSAPTTRRPAAPLPPDYSGMEPQRVMTVLSERRLSGVWLEGSYAYASTILGSSVYDFRDMELPPGVTTVNIFSLMGEVKVIVPQDVLVESRLSPVLANVNYGGRRKRLERDPSSRILRLTGLAIMSEVTIVKSEGEPERPSY